MYVSERAGGCVVALCAAACGLARRVDVDVSVLSVAGRERLRQERAAEAGLIS